MRYALLPAKPIALGKSRLAPHLRDVDRQALCLAMFQDVLECLCRASEVDAVAVVSADRRLLDIALRMRALPVDEGTPRGLNAAVALGTSRCMERGATSLLVVLSDLPEITHGEIDALFSAVPPDPLVRLVRSHEGLGTNALLRQPADVIPTRFGGRSYQGHRHAAGERAVSCTTLDLPGLEFDVDTLDDVQRLLRVGRQSRTRNEARKIGLDLVRSV